MFRLLYLLFIVFISGSVSASVLTSDFDKIRERVISKAFFSVNSESVRKDLNSLSKDGTWPDIDYKDVSRTGFQHTVHLSRMLELANAYSNKDSEFKGNKKVFDAFEKSMNYWLKHDFQCENWWNNEIGTPMVFISILLVMDGKLDKSLFDTMLPIASRANLKAWGARPSGDRIKIAGLQAKTALICRDIKQFEYVISVIMNEMKFADSQSRGLQYDYSFHHRPDRVNNTLSYGLQFVTVYAEWAEYISGTKFSFSDESIKLAVDYYLDGVCKQMVYGRVQDTGIKNRDITRIEKPGYASVVTPQQLFNSTDYRKEELKNIINARSGKSFHAESFAKFFWQTEHFVFQRPDFYTSVRMFSTRNRNMEEPYNGEGLKNHFRADGTNYLSLTGEEYFNISPIYDWRMIPGTTELLIDEMPEPSEIQKKGFSRFAGAVTDGLYGAVGFDFTSSHYSLKAKKSWFFFDDMYVCLGTDINSDSENEVITTLAQSYLDGDVFFSENGGTFKAKVSDREVEMNNNQGWVLHGNTGYVFIDSTDIGLYTGKAKGSWFSVNCQSKMSKKAISDDVFKLWIKHGKGVGKKTYSYMVLPNTDKNNIDKLSKDSPVRVLSNNTKIQSVDRPDAGIFYSVVYDNGMNIKHDSLGKIEMGASGILMVKYKSDGRIEYIAYSDPTRKLDRIRISISGKQNIRLNDDVEVVYDKKNDITHITSSLPIGEFRGKSIKIDFR